MINDFICEQLYHAPGHMVLLRDFHWRLVLWCTELGRLPPPTKHEVIRALPPMFPYGKHNYNRRNIGNLSWHHEQSCGALVIRAGDRLVTCQGIEPRTLTRAMGAQGYTAQQIADQLNAAGYRTPRDRDWCKGTITRILKGA